MNAAVVGLCTRGPGSATATVDLGSPRPFLAWGTVTFVGALAVYDRDNGGRVEVVLVDGVALSVVGTNGADGADAGRLGREGDRPGEARAGAVRGFGRRVTFRLRTSPADTLEHHGVGCVLTLD